MKPLKALFAQFKEFARSFILAAVDLIVRFKRWTEKLFLPHQGRVKPEGYISLEALLERFPRYLGTSGGPRCGAGWYPIVWDLCTAIKALEHLGMPRISGIKAEERLGGLALKAGSRSYIVRQLVRDAAYRATTVCEECGAPGALRLGRGFAKTLCAEHASRRKRPRHRREGQPDAGALPTLLFLDTEFTDFEYPQLISIALVAESGERFYAELADGWSRESCSSFVEQNILPQLTGAEFLQERYFAGRRLVEWLGDFGAEVRVVTDAPGYDWVLLLDLLEGFTLPDNLSREPVAFYADCFPELFDLLKSARSRAFAERAPHHALSDAEALREAWEVMKRQLHPAILDQYLRHF
jgi:hypothetical protein